MQKLISEIFEWLDYVGVKVKYESYTEDYYSHVTLGRFPDNIRIYWNCEEPIQAVFHEIGHLLSYMTCPRCATFYSGKEELHEIKEGVTNNLAYEAIAWSIAAKLMPKDAKWDMQHITKCLKNHKRRDMKLIKAKNKKKV